MKEDNGTSWKTLVQKLVPKYSTKFLPISYILILFIVSDERSTAKRLHSFTDSLPRGGFLYYFQSTTKPRMSSSKELQTAIERNMTTAATIIRTFFKIIT